MLRAEALRAQFEARRALEADRLLKLEEHQRKLGEDRLVRGILQRHGGNLELALPEVMSAAPGVGLKLSEEIGKAEKAREEARKTAGEAMKVEIENARSRTEYGLGLLRGLGEKPHPEVYGLVRKQITEIDPDLSDLLPETYEPERVQALHNIGLKASEFYERQQKGLEAAIKGDWRKGIGTVLSTAQSEEDWQEMRSAFKALGAPERELGFFGAAYSPEAAARAAELTMSPEERSQAAARASEAKKREMEMSGTLPMTEYQRAQVAGDAAQRGIAAGHLSVARAREAREGAADLTAVVGPDGAPILVPTSEAKGKRPVKTGASGVRSVTSGDANRLADFQTALDDVEALKTALSGSRATGTGAWFGAVIPAWMTDITGVGTESKQKQATIDRVKQVIGKTLEGGVLRKEDEIKYEKILPTIKDPGPVAAKKLSGLEEALTLRMERQMEALEDAGYDVSSYRSRVAVPGGGGGSGESRYDRYLKSRGRQ